MPSKKDVLYPFFLEACELTDETYWKTIFEDMAYGICPYGSYISRDFLCCNLKGNEFSYKIEKKRNIKELYTDVRELLSKNLSISSHSDKIKNKYNFFEILEEQQKNDHLKWGNIRKKNIKDIMIEKFIIKKKSEFTLTWKQCKSLLSIIYVGLIFKVITASCIKYNNETIENIEGIIFSDRKIKLTIDIYNNNVKQSVSHKNETILLSDLWDKYITNLQK